ncbi:MAG: MoaD/ThiS family protein [Coriobacteriia bacterium]|nr:MoaD/ThiS family protein [Coriobacteriia bacterium]
MNVHLALFANLSQYQPDGQGGRSSRVLALANGSTVGSVVALLGLPDDPRIIFVNGRHAEEDRVLDEGDRLAIFPPVAGG